MNEFSDALMLSTYKKAVELELEPAFIQLLKEELERRQLQL
ncbi:sporulation histidine kinase inhibitor Sda [Domibacillus epiphyticus]|uniref:Sporulation protein n=1 Tax=Domibacillus epiphyticus TaxID=1714355 RepID=A0A1V2AAR5_9BACI|nr:sporulation histidine kinase inhibitor Sda [Domibacillus epiphyticus]OMP67894.1 sporulation protein [Domibacillus epiphyticus]